MVVSHACNYNVRFSLAHAPQALTNTPPVAEVLIKTEIPAVRGQMVLLDASTTKDPEHQIMHYKWSECHTNGDHFSLTLVLIGTSVTASPRYLI